MPHHQLPKKVFPVPYQVDFTVESKGRHLDSTKRKLTWKFGFAHPPAVFPHLYDSKENYIGDTSNDGSIVPYEDNPKKGVECRGREHEVILTWSLLTGKAQLFFNSKMIYRHEPIKDEIFNPFSAQFHKGFKLPDPKFNGDHHIDIRCYSRTPLGAKNMAVDANGSRFRQYDLTVDGLSYFNMPAVFELGTDRMWAKVSRWGMMRADHEEGGFLGGDMHTPQYASNRYKVWENAGDGTQNGADKRPSATGRGTGRMVDEYYLDEAKRKSGDKPRRYGQSISNNEYRAMNPRSDSEEDRMVRIAMEASLKDWEKDAKGSGGANLSASSSAEENDGSYGNGRQVSRNGRRSAPNKMASIGEDNLIDFGPDEAAKAVSQISISRQTTSDVSVLGDDDATTASFVLNTAWGSNHGSQPQQSPRPPPTPGQMYGAAQPPPPYQDPTFGRGYRQPQQPWSSAGTISTNPTTPRGGLASDASFAVAPPPTWDDYNQAFGGSTMSMGASVAGGMTAVGGSMVMVNPTPPSPASIGMTSPTGHHYGGMQAAPAHMSPQFQAPSLAPGSINASASSGAPAAPVANRFDPLRADPFAT